MTPKDIIIFTQFYPYTNYDGYFERELFEISRHFDRVFLVSRDLTSTIVRPLPDNAKSFRFLPSMEKRRLIAFRHLVSGSFWKELKYSRESAGKNNAINRVRYILAAFEMATLYEGFILNLIKSENCSPDSLMIYSYWLLEHSFASGSLKERFKKMKVIARAHSFDHYFDRSPVGYLPLKRLTFEKIDALYFISAFGRRYFTSLHHINEKEQQRLHVAYLGIPAASGKQLQYASPTNKFRIASNAYIQPLKRIDLIAAALAEIDNLEIEWIHFGDPHPQIKSLMNFEDDVRRILYSKRNIHVIFKGSISNEEILLYYQQNFVDLFVNVSTTEGIPVSIMEAFSFGIPAFATSVGGNPEIVNDENGKLLKPDITANELADAFINFLLLPNDEKEKYRQKAFNTWQTKFNAEINYALFVKEISSL